MIMMANVEVLRTGNTWGPFKPTLDFLHHVFMAHGAEVTDE